MKLIAIVIAKNESERIEKCIKSLSFADRIMVIDDMSIDDTASRAQKLGADVFVHKKENFAKQRMFGISKVKTDWILYVDSDEVVDADLQNEIEKIVNNPIHKSAYRLQRKNIFLGKEWPKIELLERLFFKPDLLGWFGQVHESPKIKGEVGTIESGFLIHTTHRSLSEMVEKTLVWSEIEARLRYDAHHPPVSWWRIPRVMVTTFFDWYIMQGGWRVGTIGLIESMYQAFSMFITYSRLWEMQNKKV